MLGPPGTFDFMMLSTPTRKVKRRPILISIFLVLFFVIQSFEVINIYPHLQNWQIASNIAICVICFVSAMMAICRNPGFLQKEKGVPFIQLVEVFDSTQLCADCETVRTSRSRHCYVCNKCVERYDHHCPWINNCVGLNNHNSFYLFVAFMSALLAISLS